MPLNGLKLPEISRANLEVVSVALDKLTQTVVLEPIANMNILGIAMAFPNLLFGKCRINLSDSTK